MNIKNLIKARDAIMGCDPELFNMDYFRANARGFSCNFYNVNNCGTIGCFLGWMPFVKDLEPIENVYTSFGLNFSEYSARIFGIFEGSETWSWLFAFIWENVDNTPIGAALRCNYLIENGKPPENWEDQIYGRAPYIFKKKIR